MRLKELSYSRFTQFWQPCLPLLTIIVFLLKPLCDIAYWIEQATVIYCNSWFFPVLIYTTQKRCQVVNAHRSDVLIIGHFISTPFVWVVLFWKPNLNWKAVFPWYGEFAYSISWTTIVTKRIFGIGACSRIKIKTVRRKHRRLEIVLVVNVKVLRLIFAQTVTPSFESKTSSSSQ